MLMEFNKRMLIIFLSSHKDQFSSLLFYRNFTHKNQQRNQTKPSYYKEQMMNIDSLFLFLFLFLL